MTVTKNVNFPCSDASFVVLTERMADVVMSIPCKNVRVVKRTNKAGVLVKNYYVPDWILLDVLGIKKMLPLWQMVANEDQLHKVLEGEGRIHHDGSNSFLPENFRRDPWPELDASVLETKEPTAKTGQTPENIRVQ